MTDNDQLKRYRNPYEIIYKILHALFTAHSRTFVMYEAKLTWKMLENYFDLCLSKELIKKVSAESTPKRSTVALYVITKKGKDVYEALEKVRGLLDNG